MGDESRHWGPEKVTRLVLPAVDEQEQYGALGVDEDKSLQVTTLGVPVAPLLLAEPLPTLPLRLPLPLLPARPARPNCRGPRAYQGTVPAQAFWQYVTSQVSSALSKS